MNNDRSSSGLWLGFVVGAFIGVGASYFLGTKSGRKIFKDLISNIEELEEPLKRSLNNVLFEFKDIIKEQDVLDNKLFKTSSTALHKGNSVSAVIDKIKGIIPEKK